MLNEVIKQVHDNQLNMQWESKQLEQIREEIKQSNRRTTISIAGGALLITAVLSSTPLLPVVTTLSPLSWAIALIGLILLVYGLVKK